MPQTPDLAPVPHDFDAPPPREHAPRSIRAVEAYQTGALAPVRFRPVGPIGGGDCGVLVFWTRVGFGR